MNDELKCPKCDCSMQMVDGTYALPVFVPKEDAGKSQSRINPQSALPVEVRYCSNCRHVELVAG
jgi:Zn-finger nucleic acid-binding protein